MKAKTKSKSAAKTNGNGTTHTNGNGAMRTRAEARDGERYVESEFNRTWKPLADDDGHQLVCEVGDVRDVPTRYGEKRVMTVTAIEDGEDGEDEIGAGEVLDVWLSAGLRVLARFNKGTVVRIVPAGWGGREGKRRVYDVFARTA